MKRTLLSKLSLVFIVTLSALLTACGGGGGGGGGGATFSTQGALRVFLTDAPACGFDDVNVTVSKVRIHQSASADENAAGWTDITLASPQKIDLLSLVNGDLLDLGSTALTAGQYNQIRLVLVPNSLANPLNNSVTPTAGVETALTIPAGIQTGGISITRSFTITTNETNQLALDFDACQSVVTNGVGNYSLSPVISVIPVVGSGGIAGFIDPALLGSNVVVTAQQNGVVMKATVPVSDPDPLIDGEFILSPLATSASTGAYDVVITADGRVTAVITGVPVTTGVNTPVSTNGVPLTLAGSGTNTISGTATPAGTAATARAIQNLSPTGPIAVTVKSTRLDLATDAYSLTLPIVAPVVGAFGGGTLPIAFSSVVPAQGLYTVEGTLTGSPTNTQTGVNIFGGSQIVNFTF